MVPPDLALRGFSSSSRGPASASSTMVIRTSRSRVGATGREQAVARRLRLAVVRWDAVAGGRAGR